MANKISVVIDIAVDRASTALGNFRKSITDADGAVGKFKAGAASAGDSLKANIMPAAAAAGAAVAAFAVKSIRSASDLAESTNAVNVSFGKAAEGVLEIGENSAESMGLSQAAFNEAAVGFAAFAESIAGPGGDAADVIGEITTRASDFASVMNLEVSEAANVFRSALSGETEPIKKFGIDLSAAAVEAYALGRGLAKSKGEMTEAVKVQARYGLLMEKTSKFAGDFANTSDGLANSTRIASARMEDFQAKIGEKLIPTVETAVGIALDLADAIDTLGLAAGGNAPKVGENASLLETFQKAAMNAVNPLSTLGETWDYVTDTIDDGVAAIDKAVNGVDEAATATQGWAERIPEADEALGKLNLSTGAYQVAAEKATKAIADQERAQERTNESIRAAQQAVNDLMSAQLSAIDSNLGYRNAQADAAQALREYGDAASSGQLSTDELAAAARDAEGASLSQAAAAVQLAEDQAAANGSSLTAIERNQIYKNELEALASYASGPLKAALEDYIATLGRIPRSVQTSVGFSRGPTAGASGYRAGGGMVAAGGTYVVGEDGPEVLQMGSSSGNVVSNDKLSGMGGLDPVKWGQMAADAFSKRMQTNGRAS